MGAVGAGQETTGHFFTLQRKSKAAAHEGSLSSSNAHMHNLQPHPPAKTALALPPGAGIDSVWLKKQRKKLNILKILMILTKTGEEII